MFNFFAPDAGEGGLDLLLEAGDQLAVGGDQRWPQLFGQNVPFLKWRLAVVCLRGGEPCRQVVKVHSMGWNVKRSVRPSLVVERQVAFQSLLGCADGLVGVQTTFSYVLLFQSRSTDTWSRQQPVPSMLICMPRVFRIPVNSRLVNWSP